MKDAFKCCFCLDTVHHPVVMCHQTHMACFDCLLEQLRLAADVPTCAMCRSAHSLRFDRLVTDIVPYKKRKRPSRRYEVFLQLLDLKKKSRYRPFNRTIRKFAKAAQSDEIVEQMSQDIQNIVQARISSARLKKQAVYDAKLYAHISI